MSSPPQSPDSPRPSAPANAPFADGPLILRLACELAGRTDATHLARALSGRKLALVADDGGSSANMFCLAAMNLGAHISLIRPNLTASSDPQEIRQTARILGKLYAALEWPGIPVPLLAQLEKDAAIPIFDGISQCNHPLARLSEELGIEASADAKWRLVIQALLLRSLQ